MNETIESRIKRIGLGKTTKSQRTLLRYFADADRNRVIFMSITELAEATGVAEATVLRFCRSLGFRGYQEFKLHLAQETSARGAEAEGGVSDLIDGYQAVLEDCRKRLTPQLLEGGARMISSARTVSCCGVGNSYTAALELHNRLLALGVASYCEQDVHFLNMLVSSRSEQDLLIVFSISGGSKDVLEAAEIAREQGMKLLAITCYEKSPLARLADYVITSAPVETPDRAGAMAGKILQLCVADALLSALRQSDRARFDENIRRSNEATARKRI